MRCCHQRTTAKPERTLIRRRKRVSGKIPRRRRKIRVIEFAQIDGKQLDLLELTRRRRNRSADPRES